MPHPVTAIHLSPVVQMKSLKHYCLIYQQVCLYKKKYEPRIGGPSELAALSGRLVRLAQKPALDFGLALFPRSCIASAPQNVYGSHLAVGSYEDRSWQFQFAVSVRIV
jgi:hypothetical protein